MGVVFFLLMAGLTLVPAIPLLAGGMVLLGRRRRQARGIALPVVLIVLGGVLCLPTLVAALAFLWGMAAA